MRAGFKAGRATAAVQSPGIGYFHLGCGPSLNYRVLKIAASAGVGAEPIRKSVPAKLAWAGRRVSQPETEKRRWGRVMGALVFGLLCLGVSKRDGYLNGLSDQEGLGPGPCEEGQLQVGGSCSVSMCCPQDTVTAPRGCP